MALERKPVETVQEPGYPSADEYVTGRRAFIGLLGLTALGVGGLYMVKKREVLSPGVPPAIQPSAVQPPPTGQASLPEARLGGEVAAPQLTPPGEVPAVISNSPSAPSPIETVQPQVPPPGGLKPVRPQAQLQGDVMAPVAPRPPARPQAAIEGDVADPQPPVIKPEPAAVPEAQLRGRVRSVQPPALPKAATDGKPRFPEEPKPSAAP